MISSASLEKIADRVVDADVLVLGAGAAGCMAAIAASEKGAKKVVIVDKGVVVSCGCTGAGQDHFGIHLNTGPDWDTDEAAVRYYSSPGWGVSAKLAEKSFVGAVHTVFRRMEQWGVEFFKNPDGSYYRTQGLGQPGPWWLMMKNGKDLKKIFNEQVRAAGVERVEQIVITSLLTRDEKTVGATGFDRKTGTYHVFRAKAVVLAMGAHQSRWHTNSTRNPYNIWQYPWNTGTQVSVAYEAGAKVKNLELSVATTIPKGFGAPGVNAFSGMGAFMTNVFGERFLEHSHPLGEKAPRGFHIMAEYEELFAGKTPLFIDSRHLREEDLEHLVNNLLPVDKHTFKDYLDQKGTNLKDDLLEVEIGEFSGGGNLHVNTNLESVNMENLFGLPFSGMLSTAMAGGYVTGGEAGTKASRTEVLPQVDLKQVKQEKERIWGPTRRETGYRPAEFEDMIRQIMSYYMGHKRTVKGLEIALGSLKRLEDHVSEVAAVDHHELMQAAEAVHLLRYCELMITGVLARKGMRGFYTITDYPPKMDKEIRSDYVVIWQDIGQTKVSYEPME